MEKQLTVPLFSQRDPKWSKLKLGTGTGTIGDFGCLLVSCAMLAKYYGKDTNPEQLNKLFIQNNSYANGNLYKWYEGLSKVYSDIELLSLVDTPDPVSSSQFNLMKNEINEGRPVILQVDFYPATAQPDMHFVLLVGYDDKNYYVADPFYGDISNLNRYGDPKYTILKYAFHKGNLSVTQPEEPLGLDLDIPAYVEDKYDLKSNEWYNKYWSLHDFIRDSIDTHRRLEKLEGEHKDLEKKSKSQDGVISTQVEQIKEKNIQIETLQKSNAENTAQLSVMSKQVSTAIEERKLSQEELQELKTAKKIADGGNVILNEKVFELEEKLRSKLKGYSKRELFVAWLFGA